VAYKVLGLHGTPMLAKPSDDLFPQPASQKKSVFAAPSRPDRRRRVRTHLHVPVFFFASGERAAVETMTQDLSSQGFYCVSPVPFPVNGLVPCNMKIPVYQPDRSEQFVPMSCRVRIARVELLADSNYGIGCAIEDYTFQNSFTAESDLPELSEFIA